MKIKKSLAALTATVSIMALATGCSSSGSSGVVDTQADKGLAVMGDTITYDRTKETLRMFGNSRVKWDGDTYEAQRVEVDLKSEEIVMKGAIKGVIGGS